MKSCVIVCTEANLLCPLCLTLYCFVLICQEMSSMKHVTYNIDVKLFAVPSVLHVQLLVFIVSNVNI